VNKSVQFRSDFIVAGLMSRRVTHLSKSVRRDESRKPLANGLLSILSLVICNRRKSGGRLIHGGCWLGDRKIRSPADSH